MRRKVLPFQSRGWSRSAQDLAVRSLALYGSCAGTGPKCTIRKSCCGCAPLARASTAPGRKPPWAHTGARDISWGQAGSGPCRTCPHWFNSWTIRNTGIQEMTWNLWQPRRRNPGEVWCTALEVRSSLRCRGPSQHQPLVVRDPATYLPTDCQCRKYLRQALCRRRCALHQVPVTFLSGQLP